MHGRSIITGAIKNSFGGLLKEVRHHAHKHIHEVLVDLMYMEKELHSGMFAAPPSGMLKVPDAFSPPHLKGHNGFFDGHKTSPLVSFAPPP
jgi:hypothetical protein